MHDMKAFVLKLLEQTGQRAHCPRMNVVQEQNAFAARLQPLHRGGDDPFRADTMMPIVGDRVGREDRKSAGGELAFEEI